MAADDLDDCALTDMMVAHGLAACELDGDRSALGGAEENAGDLTTIPRYARGIGPGSPRLSLLGRRR